MCSYLFSRFKLFFNQKVSFVFYDWKIYIFGVLDCWPSKTKHLKTSPWVWGNGDGNSLPFSFYQPKNSLAPLLNNYFGRNLVCTQPKTRLLKQSNGFLRISNNLFPDIFKKMGLYMIHVYIFPGQTHTTQQKHGWQHHWQDIWLVKVLDKLCAFVWYEEQQLHLRSAV